MSTTATSRLGDVLRDRDGVRLHFTRAYDAAPADVWDALTDPERTARWIGGWTGDPASGSVRFTMSGDDGRTGEQVTIDTCEPPRLLAVTMTTGDGPWPLTATLTALPGGGTELSFVHRLAEPYDASGVGPGWHYYLDRLGALLSDQPLPDDFGAYAPALAARYAIPPA